MVEKTEADVHMCNHYPYIAKQEISHFVSVNLKMYKSENVHFYSTIKNWGFFQFSWS